MQTLVLEPVRELSGTLRLPGSKSISNRALLLGSLASGRTRLHNLLRSDDTARMLAALRRLGVHLDETNGTVSVTGLAGGFHSTEPEVLLDLGLAGTALRPLTAALCLGSGRFVLDGVPRMRERPIGDLVDGLRPLGAHIEYLGQPGFPPLAVEGTGLRGGRTRMQGSVSSQFLTAVLMAAPLAEGPVTVELTDELASKPYIDITLNLMRRFGARVEHDDYAQFHVSPGGYRSPGDFLVEGDASSASYFLAAGAVRGPGVRVEGIGRDSIQGDLAFVEVLHAMGAKTELGADHVSVRPGPLHGVDLDLNHIPDAAMTLAVLALFAAGPTRIRNIGNWRVKETDRLAAMATELRKLGAQVEEGADYLSVTPPTALQPARIGTYGDHRMAMAFSLAALGGVRITIEDPACVEKTFPDYFQEFQRLAQR
jgi:3-phosphoshikimate 1-carboxyvinyltransferase